MLFSRSPFALIARRFSSANLDSLKSGQPRKANHGINRVELLGAVGAEPRFLLSRNGDEYSTFRLYTHVDYRKRDGDFVEQTEVHDVSVFGGLVNYVKNNVRKGSRVFVCGRLNYIDQIDGEVRYRSAKVGADTVIVAQPYGKKKLETDNADAQPIESDQDSMQFI